MPSEISEIENYVFIFLRISIEVKKIKIKIKNLKYNFEMN